MTQLTRKQLQADLDSARKHLAIEMREKEQVQREVHELRAANKFVQDERDDWRFAFKAICKAVVGK